MKKILGLVLAFALCGVGVFFVSCAYGNSSSGEKESTNSSNPFMGTTWVCEIQPSIVYTFKFSSSKVTYIQTTSVVTNTLDCDYSVSQNGDSYTAEITYTPYTGYTGSTVKFGILKIDSADAETGVYQYSTLSGECTKQ